jgi:hypothetical protein
MLELVLTLYWHGHLLMLELVLTLYLYWHGHLLILELVLTLYWHGHEYCNWPHIQLEPKLFAHKDVHFCMYRTQYCLHAYFSVEVFWDVNVNYSLFGRHLSSTLVYSGVSAARSLVFCVVFYRSLFGLLSFFRGHC